MEKANKMGEEKKKLVHNHHLISLGFSIILNIWTCKQQPKMLMFISHEKSYVYLQFCPFYFCVRHCHANFDEHGKKCLEIAMIAVTAGTIVCERRQIYHTSYKINKRAIKLGRDV